MQVEAITLAVMEGKLEHGPMLVGGHMRVTTAAGQVFYLTDTDDVRPGYGVEGLLIRTADGGFTIHPVAFNTAVLTADRKPIRRKKKA